MAAVAVLTGLVLASASSAQEARPGTGEVRGRATGPAGNPLAGVSVYVSDLERGTLTGDDGTYRLPGLPPTRLEIRFRMLGRETVVREVEVPRGGTVTLDVSLTTSPVSGGEITVTGTPTAADPLEAAQEVDVVSEEELEGQGTASLGRLLERTVDGVSAITTGSQTGKPVLRGLSGTRVRVLQDGVGQDFFQYGVRHAPHTSTAAAQRVEVVRGASSILYGSDALGGAVNVITRSLPTSPEGTATFGGRVGGSFFSNNDEVAGKADLHGAVGKVGFRAGFEIRDGGDVSTPEEPTFFDRRREGPVEPGPFGPPKYTGDLPFTGFDQRSGYAQVGVQGGFGGVQLFAQHWDNEQNFLLPIGGEKGDPVNPPRGIGQNLEQTDVTLRGNLPTGGWVLKPTLSFYRAIRQSAAPGQTIGDDPDFPIDLEKDAWTGRLEARHPSVGRLSGTVGAELSFQDTESRGPVELEPGSEILNLGVFAFEELDLDPVTLSAGARLDFREQDAEPNELTEDPDLLERDFREATGSLGVNYRFADGLALAGNFNLGFRAPAVFELYAFGVHGGVAAFQTGNPELEAERSLGVDLGLRARMGPVRGKVTGYWTRIRDYVFLTSTGETHPSGLPVFGADQTDARIYGLEGSADVSVAGPLALGGSFSVLESEGDDLVDPRSGAGGDGPLPLIPADRVSGRVELRPGGTGPLHRPRARLEVEHAFSKDAAGRLEPFSQFDDTPFGTASTESYTLLNLSLSGEVRVGTPLAVTLEVDNLLDEDYRAFLDTYKGYALSPGRDVRVKLSVPFGHHESHP